MCMTATVGRGKKALRLSGAGGTEYIIVQIVNIALDRVQVETGDGRAASSGY